MARNELAVYLSKQRTLRRTDTPSPAQAVQVETAFLPPTIDNARECKTCYAVDSCMLYRKVSVTPGDERVSKADRTRQSI